jgi:hypothetical protein
MRQVAVDRLEARAGFFTQFDPRQDGASKSNACCTPPDWGLGRNIEMLDVILLAIGLGFFVLSIGYVYACDQL